MEIPKISCIVITREETLSDLILDRIDLDFFDEIIIVPKCPSVYHRYLAAKTAKNDILYTQDDDCFVNYQVLFSKYNGQITCAMPKPFIEKYKNAGCILMGWGAYFPKTMLSCFDQYVKKYGVDQSLLREADRIFSALNPNWNVVCLPHEDLNQNGNRMGDEEHHYKSMEEALKKVELLK